MQWETVWITDRDAATEIDLNSGPYDLVEYRPTVARLRKGSLGDDPYEEVIDTIRFHVTNTTADAARRDLERVYQFFDQAELWWSGAPATSQVLVRGKFQASPIGSGQVVEWVIKGWADRESLITPPQQQTPAGEFTYQNVEISFIRRGRGLSPSIQGATTTPASGPPMSVFTATFSDNASNALCPFTISTSGGINIQNTEVWVAISREIAFAEAEAGIAFGAGGSQLLAANDAANLARGNSVMRYTADPTPAAATNRIPISISGQSSLIVPALAFRKNQASSVFDISITAWGLGNRVVSTTLTQRVSGSVTTPQLLFFQPLAARSPVVYFAVTITPITAVGGNTLDIDWVSSVLVGSPRGTIYRIESMLTAATAINVQPVQFTSEQSAKIDVTDSVSTFTASVNGPVNQSSIRGTSTQVAIFAVGGTGSSYWRATDPATGNTAANITANALRRRAFLVS